MLLVRFKCPQCGEVFRVLRFLVGSDTTRRCPKCGARNVPVIPEDADTLRLEESKSCSGHG